MEKGNYINSHNRESTHLSEKSIEKTDIFRNIEIVFGLNNYIEIHKSIQKCKENIEKSTHKEEYMKYLENILYTYINFDDDSQKDILAKGLEIDLQNFGKILEMSLNIYGGSEMLEIKRGEILRFLSTSSGLPIYFQQLISDIISKGLPEEINNETVYNILYNINEDLKELDNLFEGLAKQFEQSPDLFNKLRDLLESLYKDNSIFRDLENKINNSKDLTEHQLVEEIKKINLNETFSEDYIDAMLKFKGEETFSIITNISELNTILEKSFIDLEKTNEISKSKPFNLDIFGTNYQFYSKKEALLALYQQKLILSTLLTKSKKWVLKSFDLYYDNPTYITVGKVGFWTVLPSIAFKGVGFILNKALDSSVLNTFEIINRFKLPAEAFEKRYPISIYDESIYKMEKEKDLLERQSKEVKDKNEKQKLKNEIKSIEAQKRSMMIEHLESEVNKMPESARKQKLLKSIKNLRNIDIKQNTNAFYKRWLEVFSKTGEGAKRLKGVLKKTPPSFPFQGRKNKRVINKVDTIRSEQIEALKEIYTNADDIYNKGSEIRNETEFFKKVRSLIEGNPNIPKEAKMERLYLIKEYIARVEKYEIKVTPDKIKIDILNITQGGLPNFKILSEIDNVIKLTNNNKLFQERLKKLKTIIEVGEFHLDKRGLSEVIRKLENSNSKINIDDILKAQVQETRIQIGKNNGSLLSLEKQGGLSIEKQTTPNYESNSFLKRNWKKFWKSKAGRFVGRVFKKAK